jgi:rhamnulokinase
MQMMSAGIFTSLAEARRAVKHSFPCSVHEPQPFDHKILSNYQRFIEGEGKNDNDSTAL